MHMASHYHETERRCDVLDSTTGSAEELKEVCSLAQMENLNTQRCFEKRQYGMPVSSSSAVSLMIRHEWDCVEAHGVCHR